MCVQSSTTTLLEGRRSRFVKIMKPLLPRKLSSSARINLNRHWNELEEIYGETYRTRVTHFERLLLHNELNDNALNEVREAAAAATVATTAAASGVEKDQEVHEDLLTPPQTPSLGTSSFSFSGTIMTLPAMDVTVEDNYPMTPTTAPLAWDVFVFPPTTTPTDGDNSYCST